MANFVEEIQAQKSSFMSKTEAAKELARLLSSPVSMADFETLRNITLVAVHMQLPNHLSETTAIPSSRRAVIWGKALFGLSLTELPAHSLLCEAGEQGDKAHFLLQGSIANGEEPTQEPWTPIGTEALVSDHYWQSCTTTDTTQLATITKAAFQRAVQAAALESFEAARLQELLFTPPTTRNPAAVAEAARRLRGFKYFSSMEPAHVVQLAAAAGICPCPRGTLLYTAMQVVRLELIVLEGMVKVGEALVDDWQDNAAVEEKRPGDAVSMATSLPFASKATAPTGHYAVCASNCLILYIPRSAMERTRAEAGRDATRAKVEALLRLPGFAERSERDLLRMFVDHAVNVVTLAPREGAFRAGDTVDQVWVVMEGVVMLTAGAAAGGRRALDILELQPFEVLSAGALRRTPEPCSAIAKTPAKMLTIAATAYTEFLGAAATAEMRAHCEAQAARVRELMHAAQATLSEAKRAAFEDAHDDVPTLRRGEMPCVIGAPLATLLGVGEPDPCHHTLGVFASQMRAIRRGGHITPRGAGAVTAGLMQVLLDPEGLPPSADDSAHPRSSRSGRAESVLDPSVHQLLDAGADRTQRHASGRTAAADADGSYPATAAARRNKPPIPPATREVAAAALRALRGSLHGGSHAEHAQQACTRAPESPACQAKGAPASQRADEHSQGCAAHGAEQRDTCPALGDRCSSVSGPHSADVAAEAGSQESTYMCGGEAGAGELLPPLKSARTLPRMLNPEVLEKAEVRRPASRIEDRTSRRRALLLSCCQPATPGAPPATPPPYRQPDTAAASHRSCTTRADIGPSAAADAAAAADTSAAPALAAAQPPAVARGCTSAGAPSRNIDFDCVRADRVAILPVSGGLTLDQMFQRSAAEVCARVRASRAHLLQDRVPPCVVPRRFGWTDPDKYDRAELELRVSRAAELSESERALYIKKAAARGQVRLVEAVQQHLHRDDQPHGKLLFQRATMLTRMQLACAKHSEVQLPLDLDTTAPRMHGKMAHPSLSDVNYMLNRWAHAWARQREDAVRSRAAEPAQARPATPSNSLRALGDAPLYGYPLAP